MARKAASGLSEIIQAAVDGVVARVSARIAAAVDELAREKARSAPARATRGRRPGRGRSKRSARAVEMTAWPTDRRARRVPKFVIELTGLDTKKKLVAKYGEDVTFRRGEPLPPAKPASQAVAAKPPRVRKAKNAA
jgi:hypothetical protein